MDDVPAFTKTTGLMELNDKANKVKLCHSPNRGVPRKSSYANYLCPVISVKAGKKPKCKINSTNKKSAKAGIQSEVHNSPLTLSPPSTH
jgi:hypothetical protein